MNLSEVETYVYIDVSNIRYACRRGCDFNLDFVKLYSYLKTKYLNTQEIRYYEGISIGDGKKMNYFRKSLEIEQPAISGGSS